MILNRHDFDCSNGKNTLAMVVDTTKIDDNLHWYKDAIIYELRIKAFRASNIAVLRDPMSS